MIVPFGAQKVVGYVMKIVDDCPVDQVKPILRVLDEEPLLTREMVDLALWLADHTYSRLADTLRCLLPPGIHIKSEKYVTCPNASAELIGELKRNSKTMGNPKLSRSAGGELWDDIRKGVNVKVPPSTWLRRDM